MKDNEIIALFFARSERAITELINKYGAAIKNVASNILKDAQDAEEAVSDGGRLRRRYHDSTLLRLG